MNLITRRKFVKMSAQGLALASIPIIFRANPLAAVNGPAKGDKLHKYLQHFGVDQADIHRVMAAALERGGDYCDVFFQHKITNWIGLEDKIVDRAYANVDFGVGIRVIEDESVGYSFTEEITTAAMEKAARTASNIAAQSRGTPPVELKLHQTPNYYQIKTSWEDVGIDRKVPYLQKLNDKVWALDKRIIKSQIWFSDETSYILVATSDGRMVCDFQPMTRVFVTVNAEQDGRREEGGYNMGGRHGIDYFTPPILDTLAGTAVERTINLFDAVKPEAGEMEVVLSPGNSGILLHEAIGHGMEADFNRKGVSIFADKIGKPVAENFVSIVDDGTNPNMRGSINVDDEANDSQKTYLVRNGILESYLHDRISAKHYQVNPTGSGRRQSFRHAPMPRMRNTYMEAGPHTREEIIQSVRKGIYAESFSNGEVHIGAGDFTFYLKSGSLIENGKLTRPIKECNIIGNGPEVLTKVVMVGDDPELMAGGGSCGKNGQWAPVGFGLPTIKVSSITVGGVDS
ncbi:MAG: metallopeptidase TldD-related protein [bacterium]